MADSKTIFKRWEYQFKAREITNGLYELYMRCPNSEVGIVGKFLFPTDNQKLMDRVCVVHIINVLKQRWDDNMESVKIPDKPVYSYHGIGFIQTGICSYGFVLCDGQQIGELIVPCDGKYENDFSVIKEVCKQLAYRYGLKE